MNGAFGTLVAYDPLADKWPIVKGGYMPGVTGVYDNLMEYSAGKNCAVYGGGNNFKGVDNLKMWRLNADHSFTAMPDSPRPIGVSRGFQFSDEPVTGNFLACGFGELWELNPDDKGAWTKQTGARVPPADLVIIPNSTSTKGWPTWTTPVLRWAKSQGAITGYAHSASGLQIDPAAATKRLLVDFDKDGDGKLSRAEVKNALLPEAFEQSDTDKDGFLTLAELEAAHQRAAGRLPNLAIPELNSVGAQEIFVTTAQGLCDFISAMDTARIPEWNCWYHIMNCGFPLKVSGETDFPCMSGSRVGQGRVYVQLGKVERVDFTEWCTGLAKGRSYDSDGYAHALAFTVDGKSAGHTLELAKPGKVTVKAKVAFAAETPLGIAHGGDLPREAAAWSGDTVTLHGPKNPDEARRKGGTRRVELIVNGNVVAGEDVPADDKIHDINFNVPIERSSWVALRHFPQMHTNPVTVRVAGQPIRASKESALWCAACIEQLWRARGKAIRADERETAHATFRKAIEGYRKIAAEAPK